MGKHCTGISMFYYYYYWRARSRLEAGCHYNMLGSIGKVEAEAKVGFYYFTAHLEYQYETKLVEVLGQGCDTIYQIR